MNFAYPEAYNLGGPNELLEAAIFEAKVRFRRKNERSGQIGWG